MATDARGNPIFRYGDNDPRVSWLKQVMNWWGYYDPTHPDAAAGPDAYGWDIANAVASFQQKHGIVNSGVADEATWYAIQLASEGYDTASIQQLLGTGGYILPTTPFNPAPERGGGGTPTTDPATNALQRDAMARLQQVLNQYGLGDMTEWIRGALIAGKSEAEIQLELYDQPAFKARFPAIEARRAAGLTPVSPAEILEYEQRGRELMRQAGITGDQFTSSTYLQGIMTKDVSLAEIQSRLNDGLLRIKTAPQEVRNAFGTYFGTSGDVALAQFFLDPENAVPELERMATTAIAGGIGQRFQVQLTQQIAREIADTGVSDSAIWGQFQKLDSISSIFNESISETEDLTKEGAGVGAVFGTQPGAAEELQRRVDTRLAAFKGGGGAAALDQGVIGLGVADA